MQRTAQPQSPTHPPSQQTPGLLSDATWSTMSRRPTDTDDTALEALCTELRGASDPVAALREQLSRDDACAAAVVARLLGASPLAEGTAPPPCVRTDCTAKDFSYPADTRREERWPEDSPEYLAGNERHNRYKPPPPEIEGDVFDRQRCIVGFDQGLIERQVCLVLGTGGALSCR